MAMTRRHFPSLRLLVFALLLSLTSLRCNSAANPSSLWLSYAQSELNLVLIDFEPPPF